MASDQAPSTSRVTANTPDAIADLFNIYFASVFTSDSASNTNTDTESLLQANPDPCLSNLIFTTSDIVSEAWMRTRPLAQTIFLSGC